MLLLLKKVLSPPPNTHRLLLRCLSATLNPKPFLVEAYLVTSCGFPPDKAVRGAKKINHLKSPEKPDSVIRFLKQWGFDDTNIRRIVSSYPPLLCCNVEKSLNPNIRTLLDMGFSQLDLPRLITHNPQFLAHNNIGPRIQFWRTLLGNDHKKLLTLFNKNRRLLNQEVTTSVIPKFTILKNHGLSDQQIQRLLLLGTYVFTGSTTATESLLKWTVDLGISPDSSMFVYYLRSLSYNGKALFNTKMELLKKYGWSEQEFLSAFKRYPLFICCSPKTIQAKVEFLVGRAGCLPCYIAHNANILEMSLEKRLMPRNHILQILKTNEVATMDLHRVVRLSEKMFLEKCIHRFEHKVPDLLKIYNDACARRFLFHL